MRRTINSTGRRRIERRHVRISLRAPAPGGPVRFEPTFDLAELRLPGDGRIVVEAYRHEATERFAFGTVAAPRPEGEPELRELTAERLAFRVKVVDPASHRLLALARRLPPVGDDGDRDRRRELFRVRTADLGEELWRVLVDEDDAPWLELNRDMPDVLQRFRQPELRAAILPAAMRTVLLELAMRDADADQEDDPDSWTQRWLRFAEELANEEWPGGGGRCHGAAALDRPCLRRLRRPARPDPGDARGHRGGAAVTAPIRRLNRPGRDEFRAWLGRGAPDAVPRHLLDDRRTTEPLPVVIPRPEQIFASRFELGETLVELLGPLDVAAVRLDVGLWDWLSLHLFDQLCPPKASGGRELRRPGHYALEIEDHQRRYRHLVRSAWTLVRLHGADARFILARPLPTHGEASEQLGAYQDLINCRSLIAALSRLCWDDERQAVKRGFLDQQGGSVRRVPPVMKQFRLTYDIDSMSPDEILGLLPREFDRFRPAQARPRPQPQARPADDERPPGMMRRLSRGGAGRM